MRAMRAAAILLPALFALGACSADDCPPPAALEARAPEAQTVGGLPCTGTEILDEVYRLGQKNAGIETLKALIAICCTSTPGAACNTLADAVTCARCSMGAPADAGASLGVSRMQACAAKCSP